jgi:ABC transporter substrate binding protein (PQQ-dependent alcohol dehydrogenase system)
MRRPTTALAAAFALAAATAGAAEPLAVRVLYLERQVERPPVLYNYDPHPQDEGLAGALLGVDDNATTGKFLGQSYELGAVVVPPGEDFLAAARAALAAGDRLIVANAPAADLLALADLPEAEDALIFNGGAWDDALRGEGCRANVLHSLPALSMLTDALAQFLMVRQWDEWFLVQGEGPGDAAYVAALRASAEKFGAEIVDARTVAFDADMRRNMQQEGPALTQGEDHDVIVVADVIEDWARYLPFNTWQARPVVGTEGLRPVAWDGVLEQWGAVQLQNRFERLASRRMLPVDYGVWAAVRSIGEAATRTGAADPGALRDYLLSDRFELAGFKGLAMTYRPWDGQLRQPIPLVTRNALAGLAPFDAYLHEVSPLDTLGVDRPETDCEAFE